MTFPFDSNEFNLISSVAAEVVDRAFSAGFESLSWDERTLFLIWITEGEVGNGGMHAVCYNSTGDYLQWIPQAYRSIGHWQKAGLFDRLREAFGPSGPSSNHAARIAQHERLSDKTCSRIDALDEEFFALPDSIDDSILEISKRLKPANYGA